MYMSSAVGAVVALDPTTGKTLWYDRLPPRAGRAGPGARRGHAEPRLLDRWQATRASSPTSAQSRRAQRQDRKALRRLRRQRPGRSDEGLRASDHRLALEQRTARRQGRRHRRRRPLARHRHPQRTRARAEGDAARRRARLRRANGQAAVDVPRRAAQGRAGQRDVARRLVDLLRQQRRVVADQRRRGARLRLPAARRSAPATTTAARGPATTCSPKSIVCLDARTGKRVWHFQTLHHGLWDYDLPAAPVLADITVNGTTNQGRRAGDETGVCLSCSIARRASRCGRSKRGQCRRATCPASGTRRRSRFRRSRRRSISRASPTTT